MQFRFTNNIDTNGHHHKQPRPTVTTTTMTITRCGRCGYGRGMCQARFNELMDIIGGSEHQWLSLAVLMANGSSVMDKCGIWVCKLVNGLVNFS